ncbi:MAG: PIN domain-containing protein [Candidatus Lokiarchaeota archaeon]|nr:PIN domain-containing protein [Candidatus Lokiarchaeota archaeon]
MTIILDSNFLFAISFKKDKNFHRAYELLNELNESKIQPLLTNNLVLEETLTLVVARFNGNSFHLDKVFKLFWGEDNFFQIEYLRQDEYKTVFNDLKKYTSPERLLSSVDASLITLYQKYKADKILSFDSHFDNILERLY